MDFEIFGVSLITITCVFSLLVGAILEPVSKHPKLHQLTLILTCLSFAYMLFYGVNLLIGWESPIDKMSGEEIGQAAASRRGGIFVLIIKFWPYVLIGWSTIFLYYLAPLLLSDLKRFLFSKKN